MYMEAYRVLLINTLDSYNSFIDQNDVLASHLPLEVIRQTVEIVDAVYDTSTEIVQSRKRALEAGGDAMNKQVGRGKDMMSILCKYKFPVIFCFTTKARIVQANERSEARDRLSDEEVVAQISYVALLFRSLCRKIDRGHRIFTVAAVDTTSSALARTLWILSRRQDAQDKLREEIREARKGGRELGFDELMSLPYMDAVCRETLRL